MARPNPVLLLRDPAFSGRANLVSVTSEADLYPGVPVAGTTNEGDLLPACYAHAVLAEYDATLAVVRAGGPYRTAEWRWKNTSDADSTYRGVDQINALSLPHDPYTGVSGYRNVLAACFAKRLNKIFLYWATGSEQILIRYRTAGDLPTSWTSATVTLPRPIVTISLGGLEVVEMPDGSLRMLVIGGHAGSADNDVDVYSSTNGTSWTLASRNVVSKQTGGLLTIWRIKAAASGDWIRLVVITAGTTYCLVSSDRGASFKQLANLGTAIPSNGHTADPYGLLDLEGLDDAAGTFVMGYNDRSGAVGTYKQLYIKIASRDEDWGVGLSTVTLTDTIYRICITRTATSMVAFCVTDGGAATSRQLEGAFASLDEAADNNKWKGLAWQGGMGVESGNYHARSMTACEADGGFLLAFGLCDPDAAGAEVEQGGLVYGQLWTARSLWADETISGTTPAAADSFYVLWDSLAGSPTAWANNLWTSTNGASSSETWSSDYWRVQSDANGAAGRRYRSLAFGAAPASKWADGGVFVAEWIVRVPTTPVGILGDDYVATRVRALGATAGVTCDWSVRHSGTQIVAYDNGAASTVATLSGLDLTNSFYLVRTALTVHDSARYVEIAAAKVDALSAWSVATGTLAANAASANQRVEWGSINGLAGLTVDWRRFGFDEEDDWAQSGFSSPGSLRGAPVSARAWWMTQGVWVDWGGGSAFELDYWRARPRRRGEVDNLFLPSPQAQWVSTSLASQQLIFDADPTNGYDRFDQQGIAFHGVNARKVIVKYNGSNSGWASPITQHTLYSDVLAGLTVSAVASGYVEVSGATLEAGRYVGKWLHYTSGALSGASATIARQSGQRLYFDPLGWTSVSPATADSLVVHGSVAATLFSSTLQHRYMLVECSGTTTASGDYRIGTPVPGMTTGFDGAAVDWEHEETVANGVQLTDGVGGVRWGFEAIPPRRAWDAVARGDASKVRRVVENLLRNNQSLTVYPLTLFWDRDDVPRSANLVRFVGDVELANAGWRQETDGTWYTVGDATLRFEQEL